MACAKLWPGLIISFHVRAWWFCKRFGLGAHKTSVKWVSHDYETPVAVINWKEARQAISSSGFLWNVILHKSMNMGILNSLRQSHIVWHYCDVIMSVMASQITSLKIVYSTVYSGADQRKLARVSHNQGYHLVCTWGQKWKFIYGPKNNWIWRSIDYSVWNQNIVELSLIFIELWHFEEVLYDEKFRRCGCYTMLI